MAKISLSTYFLNVLFLQFTVNNILFFPFRFGRKKVVFVSLGAQCVAVMLQSFSHSWRMFCIMFLFVGASQISIYISAFVLGKKCKILLIICLVL